MSEQLNIVKEVLQLIKEKNEKKSFQNFLIDEVSNSQQSDNRGEEEEKEIAEALVARPIDSYKALEFPDPLEMFLFFEGSSGSNRTPYKWQGEILNFLSRSFSAIEPLRFYLVANNGSGKDAYIIALFAIWFAACKIRSRFICTTSSFVQLEGQTESYIRSYANQVNSIIPKFFIIKKQHIVSKQTGSEIVLFTTNEPGRAEGWHPFPDYDKAEMAICINEAKTVEEEIFKHLKKCTGYNYWLEISSPGAMVGHFYQGCKKARDWNLGYDGGLFKRKITALQCPHISKKEIQDAVEEHGENNPWVRATYFAEFTSEDVNIVISPELFEKYLDHLPEKIEACPELPLRCGIDIGGTNDEDTIYACRGNYLWKSKAFRQPDTVLKTDVIKETLIDWGFNPDKDSENIFIDDGNVGKAIVDNLRHSGWEVQRVLNQSTAYNKKMYRNRGAELWFNFKRLIEKYLFWLPLNLNVMDNRLYSQLIGRYYLFGGIEHKIQLESKEEARSNGHGSPDRADGLILANSRISYKLIEDLLEKRSKKDETRIPVNQFRDFYYNQQFEKRNKINNDKPMSIGSLSQLFGMKG